MCDRLTSQWMREYIKMYELINGWIRQWKYCVFRNGWIYGWIDKKISIIFNQ